MLEVKVFGSNSTEAATTYKLAGSPSSHVRLQVDRMDATGVFGTVILEVTEKGAWRVLTGEGEHAPLVEVFAVYPTEEGEQA